MSVFTEEAAHAMRANFRRLSPAERREVLRQLIADLDLPQGDEWTNGESVTKLENAGISGSLLEWLEEQTPKAKLEAALSQYLPDFSASLLTDPQQRLLVNQRLSELGPIALYDLHQKIVQGEENLPRFTPEEIVEKTWGVIRGIDRETLREIIEDEDYCGY